MTFPKNLAAVGWAILALMCVSSALFGATESQRRFDPAYYSAATYAPRIVRAPAIEEAVFTEDMTPAERVSEVFSQFAASDAKRVKRTSPITTATKNSLPSAIAQLDRAIQDRRASSMISEPTT